jgi:hypothetical protein
MNGVSARGGPSLAWLGPLLQESFLEMLPPDAFRIFEASVQRGVTTSYAEWFARFRPAPDQAPADGGSPKVMLAGAPEELCACGALVFESQQHKDWYGIRPD